MVRISVFFPCCFKSQRVRVAVFGCRLLWFSDHHYIHFIVPIESSTNDHCKVILILHFHSASRTTRATEAARADGVLAARAKSRVCAEAIMPEPAAASHGDCNMTVALVGRRPCLGRRLNARATPPRAAPRRRAAAGRLSASLTRIGLSPPPRAAAAGGPASSFESVPCRRPPRRRRARQAASAEAAKLRLRRAAAARPWQCWLSDRDS